jgi:hypothetical protein
MQEYMGKFTACNKARQATGAKPPFDPNAAKTRGTSALLNRYWQIFKTARRKKL